MLAKNKGKRKRGWHRIRWLDSITNSNNMNLTKFWKLYAIYCIRIPYIYINCMCMYTSHILYDYTSIHIFTYSDTWTAVWGQHAMGLPRWHSGKESTCQCRRCKRRGFNPWVKKIPWRRKWQPSPVFLSEKFHGWRSLTEYSPWGHKESDMTEQPSR